MRLVTAECGSGCAPTRATLGQVELSGNAAGSDRYQPRDQIALVRRHCGQTDVALHDASTSPFRLGEPGCWSTCAGGAEDIGKRRRDGCHVGVHARAVAERRRVVGEQHVAVAMPLDQGRP